MPGSGSPWRNRARTAQAAALLVMAQLLIAFVPMKWWRGTLGAPAASDAVPVPAANAVTQALRLAAHIDRAAARLPWRVKCLPQAMALGWTLRLARIPYRLHIAVRPPAMRDRGDGLHAWMACGETVLLGNLPGPWIVTLCLAPVSRKFT